KHMRLIGWGVRWQARVVAVHVGAERVGQDARVEHLLRHRKAEMRAVADIDLETARDRLTHDRVNPPVLADKAAGVTCEGMRQNVARLEQVEDVRQDAVGIDPRLAALRQGPELAEMDVERQLRLARDLLGEAEGLPAPTRKAADFGMRLDAFDEVA